MKTTITENVAAVASTDLVRLLPCPYCGSPAEFDYSDHDREEGVRPFIKCSDDDCNAFGPNGHDPAESVKRWNRRSAPRTALAAMKKQAQYSKSIAEISGHKVHVSYENGFLDAIREMAKIMDEPDSLPNVKAHPPLPAGAEVDHGVKVVTTGCHLNRAAGRGWMSRLVSLFFLYLQNGANSRFCKTNRQKVETPVGQSRLL